MKAKKNTITEEDIQKALSKFEKEGGLIRRLPDEVTPRNTLVGGRWGVYETISATSSPS